MGIQNQPVAWRAGMIIYGIALLLYIIGFATPDWFTIENFYTFSLFKYCTVQTCYDLADAPFDVVSTTSFWQPGLGLTATGLPLLVIGGLLVVLGAVLDQLQIAWLVGALLTAIGGALGVAGGVYYLVQGGKLVSGGGSFTVNYSSILLIVGSITGIVSGVILLASYSKRNSVMQA